MLKKILIGGAVISSLAAIPFAIWFLQDEAPLDYRSFKIELGPNDPEVNGYTQMRQFADSYEVVGMDDYDLAQQDSVSDWDIPAVEAAIEQNDALLKTFDRALGMKVFQMDQETTPETLIPEVGDLRSYFRLRVAEARLGGTQEGAPTELEKLNHLSDQIITYAGTNGALIHLLSSVALAGIVEAEYYRLLSDDLTAEECIDFSKSYAVPEIWTPATVTTYKQEFWFSAYCIELTADNPAVFLDLASIDTKSNIPGRVLYSKLFLKKNRTINRFFELNSEIIREVPKFVKDRKFSLNDQITDSLEKRPKTWWVSRNPVGKVLYSILIPATTRIMEKGDQRETYGELLRIAYALKAYHLEHGNLPEQLTALIPEFISAIPLDPFDGAPLRYSKEKGIVYSVGNDFVDNGGSEYPFAFTYAWDDDYDEVAEDDATEPTLALRFLPKFRALSIDSIAEVNAP